MLNNFISVPPPKAQQVSPAASKGDGTRHAQRACFAILKALKTEFTGQGLSTDDVWDYMLHTDGVSSRTELNERHYVLWQARLTAAQRDQGLFSVLCEEVKQYRMSTLLDVKEAFDTAWIAHKERVIAFLGEGFEGNLSEGVIKMQLGKAIQSEYAPRALMTAEMWVALTTDLEMETWTQDHWMHQLKEKISQKYEGRRPKRLNTMWAFRPPAEPAEQAEDVCVYLVSNPKVLLYAGVRPKCLEGYCQAYANKNHVTLTLERGNETTYFISETEYLAQRGQ